jgi:hypothetical protein
VNEIAALDAAEAAIEWAGQNLGAKNTLTAEDAAVVEAAFRTRIRVLDPKAHPENPTPSQLPSPASEGRSQPASESSANSSAADTPMFGRFTSVKPRRFRDKDHLRFVAAQPCTLCGRKPCEAHHLRYAQARALGRRVSDEFTVPLCRVHHRELHRQGDERTWWNKANIDPMPIALGFWQQTRGVVPAVIRNGEHRNLKTDVSVDDPGGAGGFLKSESCSGLADTSDGGTTT